MKNFVFVVNRCQKDISRFHCEEMLKRFASRFEKLNEAIDLSNYDRGVAPYYCKIDGGLAIVFAIEKRRRASDDITCFYVMRVLSCQDKDYETFKHKKTDPEDRKLIVGQNDFHGDECEDIWKNIDERLAKKKEETTALNENERAFLYRERSIVTQMFSTPIYETPEWVAKVAVTTGVPYPHISELGKCVEKLVYDNLDAENNVFERVFYTDVNQKQEVCYCAKLTWKDDDDKIKCGWYLIAVGTRDIIEDAKKKYAQILNAGDHDLLSRHCKRGYPFEYFDNLDQWTKMEGKPVSNLVLSEEEINVVSSKIDFPLFLTGRAGSGKSTMLQYLFSEYLLRSVTSGIRIPPIYLSWESELKDRAEQTAAELLEENTSFCKELSAHGLIYDNDIKPLLSTSFSTFSELVRSCIEKKHPDCLSKRFCLTDGTLIRFPEFRRMWNERFGSDFRAREEYGPELCWHIIRSYIKGWNSDGFMTPEEYGRIGEDYQDVDRNVFNVVYDKVWREWYSKIGNFNQWDDLDLVRYCLHPQECDEDGRESASCVDEVSYSAIFCDEAQDFTRVEIEFILRLSIFTKRRLTEKDVLRLPIVFAGDEAQTLNPTGFSWNSLRSYFYARLFSMLSLKEKDCRLPPVFTLTKNYRSASPIVKLGNSIQLLRHVRVGANEPYEPQLPYDTAGSAKPVYSLDPTDPEVWNQLKRLNALLIIPGAGVQTAKEFLEKTIVGQNHWLEFHDNGDVEDLMVLNPMEAKGLEFPCVALFGFDLPGVLPEQLKGGRIAAWLASQEKGKNVDRDKIGQSIALKYFLSNAYVAATRAEKQLFVLTNGRDQESFWSFAFSQDEKVSGGLYCQIKDYLLRSVAEAEDTALKVDGGLLGRIVPGGVDSLESGEVVDAKENCTKIFKKAQTQLDPKLMRRAAMGYKDLGDDVECNRCTAYASFYDADYETAAQLFADIGEDKEAVGAFWLALNADTYGRILPRLAKYSPSTYYEASVAQILLKATSSYEQVKNILEELSRKANSFTYDTLPTWSFVIGKLLSGLPHIRPQDFGHAAVVLEMAERLMGQFEMPLEQLSRMAFNIHKYEYVVRLWERKKQQNWLLKEGPCEYWLSKAEMPAREYAEKVCDFKRSKADDWKQRVLDEYERQGRSWPEGKVAAEARAVISEALMSVSDEATVKDCAAWLLDNRAQSMDVGRDWISQLLARFGSACSRVCIEATLKTKLGDGFDVRECRRFNETVPALELYQALKAIAEIRGSEFWTTLATTGKDTALVAENFISKDLRSPWFEYEVRAVGCVLEERRYYVDCCKFYEWASKTSSDPSLRRLLLARWTVNKERQTQANGETAQNPDVVRNLRAFGAKSTTELPELDMGWHKLFREICDKIPCDRKLPDQQIAGEVAHEESHDCTAKENGSADKESASVGDGEFLVASDGHSALDSDDELSPESRNTVNDKTVQKPSASSAEVDDLTLESVESIGLGNVERPKPIGAVVYGQKSLDTKPDPSGVDDDEHGRVADNNPVDNDVNIDSNRIDQVQLDAHQNNEEVIATMNFLQWKSSGAGKKLITKFVNVLSVCETAQNFTDVGGWPEYAEIKKSQIDCCGGAKTLGAFLDSVLEFGVEVRGKQPKMCVGIQGKSSEYWSVSKRNPRSVGAIAKDIPEKEKSWKDYFAHDNKACFFATITTKPSTDVRDATLVSLTHFLNKDGEGQSIHFITNDRYLCEVTDGSVVFGFQNAKVPDRPIVFAGAKAAFEVVDWNDICPETSVDEFLSQQEDRLKLVKPCQLSDVLVVCDEKVYSGFCYKDGFLNLGDVTWLGDALPYFDHHAKMCWTYGLDLNSRGLVRIVAPKIDAAVTSGELLSPLVPVFVGRRGDPVDSANDRTETDVPVVPAKMCSESEQEFLGRFKKYVEKCGFKFATEDLVRFHTSVKCCLCTLLAGRPGTGKSSLAELYMRAAVGGSDVKDEWLRVNVNPAWLEPADFLGYVKDECFVDAPNGFAKYLRELHKSTRLGMACLEEINLACVEHYFSDFIQIFDRDFSRPVLIPGCSNKGNDLHVGDNFRVIGTCNLDETTHSMSPRFLNRCNVLELLVCGDAKKNLIKDVFSGKPRPKVLKYDEGAPISAETFRSWLDESKNRPIDPAITDIVVALAENKNLKDAQCALDDRVIADAVVYIRNRPPYGANWVDLENKDNQLMGLDEFLAQRVFYSCKPTPMTVGALKLLSGDLSKLGLTRSGTLLNDRLREYDKLIG